MQKQDLACRCVRCREVRGKETLETDDIRLEVVSYTTDVTQEHFIQYLMPADRLAGFLRFSLPNTSRDGLPIPEIRDVAMVRELHIYGIAQELGQRGDAVQHRGLGTQLLEIAAEMARDAGFDKLAVIAAAGTRPCPGTS